MKIKHTWIIGGLTAFFFICLNLPILTAIGHAQNNSQDFEKIMIDVLDLKNIDILDVLKLISKKSGLNIVAGKDVQGRITVFLKDVEVMDSLDIIVEANGWAYTREGDIIKVMTAQNFEAKFGYKFGQKMITQMRALTHTKAVDIIAMLSQIKSPLGKVVADEKSNTLILIDAKPRLKEMNEIIDRLESSLEDVEPQDVKETRIVQLLFSSTADMLAVLNQVKSDEGKLISDGKSGTIILVDFPEKVDEMEGIIRRLDIPMKTETFLLSYAKSEDLSGKIAEILTPDIGKIKSDERSNTIVVTDTPIKLKEVRHIVQAFDQKDREVLIEAKILQIALSDEHKMGIDWEAIVSDYHNLKLTGDLDVLNTSEKSGRVSIGTIDTDDYGILIEALDTVGVTNVLSSPRITAVNNKEAKILVGSTEPYVTSTTTTPSSGPTTTAESVNFIEVGVKLFVTPTIHRDDFITMKIKPEVSTVVDNVTTSSNNTIPVVETSEAETTVVVKDGVTIVIGGLIKDEKIRTVKKVPVLGDIPFLKYAFRNESDTDSKNEIVIFLTPTIITGDLDNSLSASDLKY
ncbi:MAG: hypothetical protein KC713_08380 [Candidatus Omnitrophica bacterium]|nr:hypothetical protein [Candidatus Omnitrophota bacterium]